MYKESKACVRVEGELTEEFIRLSENGGMESEMKRRIGMAATTVGAPREPVFGNKELPKEAKLTVYNAFTVVVPTLVYGFEAWVLKGKGTR